MRLLIPEFALIALAGVSSSGKSAFSRKHFKSAEVLSSDYFRALVSNDENNQQVTPQAFESLYFIARKRLELGLLTVIDATNVQTKARASILALAKEYNCPAVIIVLNISEKIILERNKKRTDRNLDSRILERQMAQLKSSIEQDRLLKEGFSHVYILSEDDIEKTEIERITPAKKNDERGPFDIIGDIHGCYDELCEILEKLGYTVDKENHNAHHSEKRKAIFLGDLCDRGNKNMQTLRLVMNMVQSSNALCVIGNHDDKLLRKLKGSNVQLTHGLDKTVEEIYAQDEKFIDSVKDFLSNLASHYVLDDGKLVVSHAGLKEKYHGQNLLMVKKLCIYGETTGEKDEYGLPVRLPWANDYKGKALIVYGHIPNREVKKINNTICIDTGCVFGGKLTAYRYPENEIVQINANAEYCEPIKPL